MKNMMATPLMQDDNEAQAEPPPFEQTDCPSVAVAEPETKALPDRRIDQMPMWKVLLHNDDTSIIEDVIKTIRMLTSLPLHDAVQRTMEAHRSGVALLITTHQEHAELLEEQFRSRRLSVSIEPDR